MEAGQRIPMIVDEFGPAFYCGGMFICSGRFSSLLLDGDREVEKQHIDALDWSHESFFDAVIRGVFTVLGDGDPGFKIVIQRFAHHAHEGWFVVETEQDPKINAPLDTARTSFREPRRVMTASGHDVQ